MRAGRLHTTEPPVTVLQSRRRTAAFRSGAIFERTQRSYEQAAAERRRHQKAISIIEPVARHKRRAPSIRSSRAAIKERPRSSRALSVEVASCRLARARFHPIIMPLLRH